VISVCTVFEAPIVVELLEELFVVRYVVHCLSFFIYCVKVIGPDVSIRLGVLRAARCSGQVLFDFLNATCNICFALYQCMQFRKDY
jgi:hypothetical protein